MGYWGPNGGVNCYGRAIGIYLTLDKAGVAYEMKAPTDMPDGAAMAVPVVDVDGFAMGQTPAILASLGNIYGLAGKTTKEKMQVLHAIEDMNDVFGERKKLAEDKERATKWFTYLDNKLQGKTWIAGTAEPTVADFHGVFAFEQLAAHKV